MIAVGTKVGDMDGVVGRVVEIDGEYATVRYAGGVRLTWLITDLEETEDPE